MICILFVYMPCASVGLRCRLKAIFVCKQKTRMRENAWRQTGGRACLCNNNNLWYFAHTKKKFFHNIYRHHKHQFVIFSCSLSSSSLANISFNFLDGLVFEFVVHNKIILSTGIFTVFRCTCRIIFFPVVPHLGCICIANGTSPRAGFNDCIYSHSVSLTHIERERRSE